MRLTRGTLLLIIAAIAVIIAVLLINASPASAPAEPTVPAGSTTGGPLFPGLDAASVARFMVQDASGLSVTYQRDAEGAWALDGDATGYTLDRAALDGQMTAFAGLSAFDTFTSDALAEFGLDAPTARITARTSDGATVALYVGGANPTGTRRYVVAVASAAAEATPQAEATAEAGALALNGPQSISTVVNSTVEGWLALLTTPPYQPTATPTLPPSPEATTEATPEATAEATLEAN